MPPSSPPDDDLRVRLAGAALCLAWAGVAYLGAHALDRARDATLDPTLAADLAAARLILLASALAVPFVVFIGVSLLRRRETRRITARLRPYLRATAAPVGDGRDGTGPDAEQATAAGIAGDHSDGMPASDGIDAPVSGDASDATHPNDDINPPDARSAPPTTPPPASITLLPRRLIDPGPDDTHPALPGAHPWAALLARSPFAVALLDRELRYIACSRRWYDAFRLPPGDLVGRHHYDVFPETPGRWRRLHRLCLTGQIKQSEGEAFPRRDGRVDWIRWEIHPWYADDDTVGGLLMMCDVLTPQKEAERALAARVAELEAARDALAAHNAHLQAAARFAGLGYWIRWPANDAAEWSPEMYRIYGLPPGDGRIAPRRAHAHVYAEDREVVDARVRRLLRVGGPFRFHFRITRADGERRVVSVTGEVERPDGAHVERVFGVMADVTDQIEDEGIDG